MFETPEQRVDERGLKARAEDYKLGTVPTGALLLTAGIDVQGDRLEAVVKGWGRGEESWLIAYEQIFGDPAQEGTGSVWERLSDLLDRAWPHAGGSTLRIIAAGIDTGGHHTHEVYRYCRARERRHTIAVKGGENQVPSSKVNGLTLLDTNRSKFAPAACPPSIQATYLSKQGQVLPHC